MPREHTPFPYAHTSADADVVELSETSTGWLSAMLTPLGLPETDTAARRAWMVLREEIDSPRNLLEFLLEINQAVDFASADDDVAATYAWRIREVKARLDYTIPLLRSRIN
ncbi:hypothetical protein [Burkholderia sp. Ac-20365]|uniref:hypothetical protein n=1 Tax=Burkholderia sp. Ac-20365 TaxID=2703897 RepID=UPI00197C72C6|nr:hypothetical protein [Burkholderia sp. Ac-20365]MBN3761357.1 hypothetical protein [Burkholderia sp. Ac-20365]